jgi:hypothetical protein
VSEELQVNVKPAKKGESVRAWYHRTTSGARKFLLYFSAIAIVAAIALFMLAPQSLHASIQQFNGAYIIPVAGGIWILGFLYIFLIPQREVGFRSQEFIESMSNSVRETLEREIVPAVAVWKRVGEKIEAELPVFMKKVDEGILQIQESAKKLTIAVEKNEGLSAEVKPAIDALKRIEAKFEEEIKNGFFEKANAALDSVRSLGGIPGKEDSEENLSYALESIKKNKALRRAP